MGGEEVEMVWGMLQYIALHSSFASIITSSSASDHQLSDLEVEDICFLVLDWNQLQPTYTFSSFIFIYFVIIYFYYASAVRLTCSEKHRGLFLNPGLWYAQAMLA